MKKYSARAYLTAFEPWVLEDMNGLEAILRDDTELAHRAALKAGVERDEDGHYSELIWFFVYPFNRQPDQLVSLRRWRGSAE